MKKVLVAYFSHSGNTRLIGKTLAKELNADLLEIVPETLYPRGASLYAIGGKQAVLCDTPPLQELPVDVQDYSTIIVGTPVWAWRMAPPVRTFLQEAGLAGKRMAFFCTHAGSEGETLQAMAVMVTAEVIGRKGFKVTLKTVHDSVNAAKDWAGELLLSIGE